MFNIVKSTAQECPRVLSSAIYFTGVYGTLLFSSEVLPGAGGCP
jgi:hypothetical protein